MLLKDLKAVTGALYRKPVADLLKDLKLDETAEDTTDIPDADAIKYIADQQKVKVKERYDAGFKVAEGQTAQKLEDKLKEVFKIETDKTGEDLIKEIETVRPVVDPKDPTRKTKDLTEDEIKKLPLYLDLERKKNEEIGKLKTDHEKFIADQTNAKKYEADLNEVDTLAETWLKEIGDVDGLSSDPKIAANQLNKLFKNVYRDGVKYEKQPDGSFLLLNKDGKRIEDDQANPVSAKEYITGIAKENLSFKAKAGPKLPNQPKPNGNPTNPEPPKKYAGKAPASKLEYVTLLSDQSLDTDIKLDIKDTYGSKFTEG